jgi:hypothetical protein
VHQIGFALLKLVMPCELFQARQGQGFKKEYTQFKGFQESCFKVFLCSYILTGQK